MDGPNEHLATARHLFEAGQYAESEAAFRQAIDAGAPEGDARYGIGMVRKRQGDLAAAQEEFGRCVRVDPNNANAWYQLGDIAERDGDAELALTYYRRALAIAPQHHGA